MSDSEKNEPKPSIRGPEFKSEMAADTGLIANNLVQRIEGWCQAGGARGIRTRGTVLVDHAQQGLGWSPTILPDPINHLRVPN
jgi:hypothetical protein